MALPLDGAMRQAGTTPQPTPEDGTAWLRPGDGGRLLHPGATPPPAPLEMPTQDLATAPVVAFPPADLRTTLARFVAFGGAAALTVLGIWQMSLVFGNETQTFLQGVLLVLFAVTFGWIALSATQALAGLLFAPRRVPGDPAAPLVGRTAIIMPVYNEDPAATSGALLAMGEALVEAGRGRDFELFILSDTRDAEVWLRETAAFGALRDRLAGRMAVWYRRRPLNTGRKAGNLRDFVERWGRRYDYMLVLDADSLMTADTLAEMVRRMDAAPRLGILQTVPVLAGGTTPFARLQQFAGRLYGPVIARGVAAWQGLDGNYWGHNALIRVAAFAENCGLPELPGRMPFGGHVLSHDFVEAALIRRGGWQVRMDPDLSGSWEGSPPSLLDVAARDRRWAQGNLQHSKLLRAAGLRLPNRIHFLIGIGAYLMSPIWLGMLLVGMALTAQTVSVGHEYFPEGPQLFPNWPVFDAERMSWLFGLSMFLLLLPKLVGLVAALADGPTRRAFGGGFRLTAGAVAEVLLSALAAPVLMLMQARQVWEILSGRDSGWSAQTREGAATPWNVALRRHGGHVVAGIVPGAAFLWFAPEQLPWLAPVLAGLLIAPLLSRVTSDPAAGRVLARLGLLATPEDIAPPAVALRAAEAAEEFAPLRTLSLPDLAAVPALVTRHAETLGAEGAEAPAGASALPAGRDLAAITARAKIDAAASAREAADWMTPAEKAALLASHDLLRRFAAAGGGEGGDGGAAGGTAEGAAVATG